MAKEIKTRQVQKNIKVLDKAVIGVTHVKDASVKVKDTAKETQYQEDGKIETYASDRVVRVGEKVAGKTAYHTWKDVKKVSRSVKNKKKAYSKKESASEQWKEDSIKKKYYEKDRKQSYKERADKRNQEKRKVRLDNKDQSAGNMLDESKQQKIKMKEHTVFKEGNRTIKTTEHTNRLTVKTAEDVSKKLEQARKMSAIAVERAKIVAQKTAIVIQQVTKRMVEAAISCVKALILAAQNLVATLGAGGSIAAFLLIFVILFGGVLCLVGGGNSSTVLPVSAEVEAYEPVLQQYASQYGIPEYVELLKAVMMQESGGKGLDPMQSSEGIFNTKYPRKPNGITDPEYSICCGVQELKLCLESAKVESPIDMENIKLALQGYNFGNGYITWARENYGGYTAVNATEFSDMMAKRMGWESYGDKQYVSHVLRYYPFGRVPSGIGNQAIVQVALSQEGNVGGQPYWSWYGFENRVEWCACFVSWCAQQCGYIDSGIMPKFSLCSEGVAWFSKNGQFQDGSYIPVAGDIIFFDWEDDGTVDHVGIVENVVDGMVYTIEGNSGDQCRRRVYAIGNAVIYGYGVPIY